MEWTRLLSYERPGDPPSSGLPSDPFRNDFEKDHDRIVFSSAFRSLQNKTQVVPLPEQDFVHTRLTHSLETSCVGRSLGKMAAEHLLRDHPGIAEQGIQGGDIGSIVAAACLAHDIGNPPFGHSGEKAIAEFFLNGAGAELQDEIADEQAWRDLTEFEGNANGFRILARSGEKEQAGPTLTCATLGAFTKYPCPSDRPESEHVARKKFGFFKAEEKLFQSVAEKLGLEPFEDGRSWMRHPLSFLVEAADDICYSVIDLEDGLRAGLIPPQEGEKLLKELIGEELDQGRIARLPNEGEKWSYLRAKAINVLVNEASRIFGEEEERIRKGHFDRSLLKGTEKGDQVKAIKALSFEKLYRSRKVLEIEAAGFEVLGGLLESFIEAAIMPREKGKAPKKEKILQLLPAEISMNEEKSTYEKVLDICAFVSSMSDSYALSLYRRLKGIELPG